MVALCESRIKSRELAIDLNKLYVDDAREDIEISEWVVNVQKERLEKSFGNKFDRYILEQVAKYCSIKREVSHYFEKSRAIICPVMGVRYYSYFRLGSDCFNNKKYYNSRLHIASDSKETEPLVYIDVPDSQGDEKNTSLGEVLQIIKYASANRDKNIGVITPFVNQRKLIEDAINQEKLENVVCGTVHAFQGDEKDVVLFSTAITEQTKAGTYEWLKNNKELINVATSRAKDKLIVLSDFTNLSRLHQNDNDDLFELVQYVQKNGKSQVTQKRANSRALGVKPFSTATEEAFLENLTHALGNIWLSQKRYSIHKEVAISQVFMDNISHDDLFYSGRFDFVVYEMQSKREIPILAIELDGKEHFENEVVKARDKKKNAICKAHNLQIIRVENSYARRYNHIKQILIDYFSIRH